MKIAFIAPANSIHTAKWVNYFANQQVDCLLITHHPSSTEIDSRVELVDLSKHLITTACYKARRILIEWQPEVVHCHSVARYGLLTLLSTPNRYPLVVTPWGSDIIFGSQQPMTKIMLTSIMKRANLITADSSQIIELSEHLGAKKDQCNQINFGIDTNRFRKLSTDEHLLKSLNIPLTGPRIISTRNFEPIYDIETLLLAASEVLKRIPDAQFVLLGKGTSEKRLKLLSNQLGIAENIHFIGFVANEQIPSLLNSNDLYVSTSKSDAGIAASTAEAMSCEIPVVISDSAENSSWITDNENGFLFKTSDHLDLAKKILTALPGQPFLDSLRAKARETILQRNDSNNEMKKMLTLYEKLT